MEPAQPINETFYLKQIIELKDEIIKLQKIIIEKNQIIEKDKEIINDLKNKLDQKQEQEKEQSQEQKEKIITPNKNFNIQEKEVIFKDKGSYAFYCIYILQDGRIAAGDSSGNIIIYNKNNFKSELTIKESGYIMYLTQLKNGSLVSLNSDGSINIYNLLENFNYLILQKIKAHSARVHKLRTFDNEKRFMTCSDDCTIKFFFKDQNEYKEDYCFKDDVYIFNILRTREGEIVYSGYNSNSYVKFYDLKTRKIIDSSKVKALYKGLTDGLYKLSDTYLLVGATNSILLFDINQHRQIKEIESENSSVITSFIKIDNKCLLSADCKGNIKQWIIDGDNLILENVKNNAHEGQIRMIRRNEEGLIITCSDDQSIKIWK